jgi:acyl carrier protein
MLEKIAKIISDYKGTDIDITEETTFSDLELDSLDTVEIVMNLEEEFGVTIEMNETIQSVGDLMNVLGNAEQK